MRLNMPLLRTDRLLLRKIIRTDRIDIFAYASRAEAARYVGWNRHDALVDTDRYITAILHEYTTGVPSSLGLHHVADDRIIGTIGLVDADFQHRHAEFGYIVSPAYWGQGYATEAARAFLDWAFNAQALHRMEAVCVTKNTASVRVLEKLGFVREGLLREFLYKEGHYRDAYAYGLLRHEWAPTSPPPPPLP